MPKPISPEHYQSVGEIVVVWAKLEAHLFQALRNVSRLKMREGLIVFWQMGYRERMTVLQGLVLARYPDKNDKNRQCFETLAKRLEAACVLRNVTAHSIWLPGLKEDEVSPFDFDFRSSQAKVTGRGPKRLSYSPAALHKEALKIDRLAEDFKDFFTQAFRVRFLHSKKASLD